MARKVLIVMGSDSDFDQITPAWKVLESLGVEYEVQVASAHRSPERVVALARSARDNHFGVILAAAGGAAHLAGVIAANTTLPVVAVLHAGTAVREGHVVTAGGRVLAITARGSTLVEARERAYTAAACVSFDGMHYRRDIAAT